MNNQLARSAQDWRWFFHQAKAEIGIRSSWEPLIQIAMGGGHSTRSTGASGPEDRRRNAVSRHARIELALRALPADMVRLIRLTCETPIQPLRQPFGDLGNCAHLTDAVLRAVRASRSTREIPAWLDRLALKYANGRAGPAGLDAIEAIRLGCEEMHEPARVAYVNALVRIPVRRAA